MVASDLEYLELEHLEVRNEDALLQLPILTGLKLTKVRLSPQQERFFERLRRQVLPEREVGANERFISAQEKFHGRPFREQFGSDAKEATREVSEIESAIRAKDWERAFAQGPSSTTNAALSNVLGGHIEDPELIDELVECDNEDVFYLIVRNALNARRTHVARQVVTSLSKHPDRLPGPLAKSFVYYIDQPWPHGTFSVGKLKAAHFGLVELLKRTAAPHLSGVFRLFLEQRGYFSGLHLTAYKRLLDVVHKCKEPSLAPLVIDLLHLEEYIPEGDPAFIRKCLKAIARLSNSEHLAVLKDVTASESRSDVARELAAR